MKKILVVLLILAVAGGVFAQGSWSVSGMAELGTTIIFDEDPTQNRTSPEEKVRITSDGYGSSAYNAWENMRGVLSVGYTKDQLSAGVNFSHADMIQLFFSGDGDNYTFTAHSGLGAMLTTGGGDYLFRRLWGEYRMLNGMARVKVAYSDHWNHHWTSDTTGTIGDEHFITNYNKGYSIRPIGVGAGPDIPPANVRNAFAGGNRQPFDNRLTFTHSDSNSYLLGELTFGGLKAGVILPYFFPNTTSATRNPWEGPTPSAAPEFARDVLEQMILGVTFAQSPFEVAAQLLVKDYGIYLGGRVFFGPVTAGFSFMGVMNYQDRASENDTTLTPLYTDRTTMKIGGSVSYNGGAFGAGIKGAFGTDGATSGGTVGRNTFISVEPNFFYAAIPAHLMFELHGGFYFDNWYIDNNRQDNMSSVYWAIRPTLAWNFLGTGAQGNPGTGMVFRYLLMKESFNELGIYFKFSI